MDEVGHSSTGQRTTSGDLSAITHENEERFRALVMASADVIYRMSPDWGEMRQLDGRGMLSDTAAPSGAWLNQYIHPDDHARVVEAIREGVQTKQAFTLEHRMLRGDGVFGWTSFRAVPRLNSAGELVEWIGAATDVTNTKEAERALHANEARLRLALDVAELGTWSFSLIDGSGFLDPRAAQIVGLSSGEFADVAQAQAQGTHPDDLASMQAAVTAGIASGAPFELNYRVLHPDGTLHFVASRAVALRDEQGNPTRLVGTNRDVTAERTAEQQQRQARANAEAATQRAEMLQSLTAALAAARTLDEVATVVVTNMVSALRAASGGMSVREHDGDSLLLKRFIGVPNETAEYVRQQGIVGNGPIPESFRTSSPLFIRTRRGDDGFDARFPELTGVWDRIGLNAAAYIPLIVAGDTVGVISFGYLTEQDFPAEERALLLTLGHQAALAVERARLFAAEQTARREAEAANRAKSEFLAVMSHELRTPLNAIGGYAELMEMGIRGPVTPQQRDDLGRVQASQRHLLGLINEVLNYAKLETGTVHYDMRPVRVRDAVASAQALIAPQATAKGLLLNVVECPAGSDRDTVTVRADAEKLRQILVNLLSNSIKFTDRGGEITIECGVSGSLVRFAVRDSGIGIAADQLERIFDPFVQVRSDLTRTAEGTGLGLAISRDLARGMGGDLTVTSELGVGSTFVLTLARA